MAAKYNKRQKINNAGVGINLTKTASRDISSSTTSNRHASHSNNNNNNVYENHIDQRKVSSYHYQNSLMNSQSKARDYTNNNNAQNNNNNNINIKNIQKNKNPISNSKISSSANYNHNNNIYSSNSYHQTNAKNPKSSGSDEIVEVPDSDGDEPKSKAVSSSTSTSKTNKIKNGSVNSNNSGKFKTASSGGGGGGGGGGGVPTFIVNGSSSGSNSNHSLQNYEKQQASGSKATANGTSGAAVGGGSSSKTHADSNKKAGDTTADNGQNNSSSDTERLQREIEEVTQVPTNYVVKQDEQVDLSHFKLIRVLGTGAYGKVFLVRKLKGKDKDQLYAMKVLKKDTVVQKKKTAEHTTTERQVLEAIQQSPFLVGLHYAFQTDSKLYLVLDYVSGGELFTHLYKAEHFSESTVRVYIAEVVLALEHLHKLGIIYRDIKLENILLDGQGHIVLADFGLSKIFTPDSDHRAHSFCGTLEYMAPEIIRAGPNGHDLAVDWWSVGVLTYELLTGASPFTVVEQQNSQSDISRRIQKVDPVLPPTLGEHVKDFILKMLHKDPKKRLGGNSPNATEIKSHPFFRGINWNELKSKRRKAPFKPALDSEDDTQNFSEEFTKQPAIDSPAPVPSNTHRLFRGYSYVAPQHRKPVPEFESQPNNGLEYCNKSVLDPMPAPTNIELRDLCSSGAFGKCYLGWDESNRTIVAIKVIPVSKYRPSELDALISCAQDGHKYIAQYLGAYRSGSDIWIVQEYVPGCELSDLIVQHEEGMDEMSCLNVIVHMLDAIQHIHKRQFIHGDLKPENIIFVGDDMSESKLVDFGAASYHGDLECWNDRPRFTIDYAPPEMLEDPEMGTYSKAVDIWCLGATLYTMYMGHSPFRRGREDRAVSVDVHRQRILNEDFYMGSQRWQEASAELQSLIKGCLEKDVTKRLTLLDIVDHSWFHILHDNVPNVEDSEEMRELKSPLEHIKYEATEENDEEEEEVVGETTLQDTASLTPIGVLEQTEEDATDVVDLKLETIIEEDGVEMEQSVEHYNPEDVIQTIVAEETKELPSIGLDQSSTAQIENVASDDIQTQENVQTSDDSCSDLEDFCGFSENLSPSTTKHLKELISLLTSLRRCKRSYMSDNVKQLPAVKTAERKLTSTRHSARNVQPLQNSSNEANRRATRTTRVNTNDNNKLTKLDSKSLKITPRSTKKQQQQAQTAVKAAAAVAALKKEPETPVSIIVETMVDDSFLGFRDALNCKTKMRAFNLMLHHTQVALKHFNIERRVYNRTSIRSRQRLEKQQQQQHKSSSTTPQKDEEEHEEQIIIPANENSSKHEVVATSTGRRQPARSTRAQRARYVFE
uniref:non-specific serine/threonine protein kinase n=1 Tax=Musca domestica TaxID=7370 RepID=A0A1I8MIG7_MUSDO